MSGAWTQGRKPYDVGGCVSLFLRAAVISANTMSDDEVSSSDSSEKRDTYMDTETDDSYFVFRGNRAPYQGEPLAVDGEMVTDHVEEEDEDGILPSVLEQRFKREISVDEWCTCGKCRVEHLVGVREFRCCSEVLEATGKFTFLGLNVDCILNHADFGPLTHRTVLLQAGPLLRDREGKYYKRKNNAENKFLRAVAYRWLARWLFGPLGWENTRPLPACIYHDIRERFFTSDSKGYVSGQERADCEN